MADFKVVISDSKTGKAYQISATSPMQNKFIGKSIGDKVEGSAIGLTGYTLLITGGSDREGFPMRKDILGAKRRRILVSSGIGYRPKEKGLRRRKTMRGREISVDISQINTKIVEYGEKPIEVLLGIEKKEQEKENESEIVKSEE